MGTYNAADGRPPPRGRRAGPGQGRETRMFGSMSRMLAAACCLLAVLGVVAGGSRPSARGRWPAGYDAGAGAPGVVRGPDAGTDDAFGAGGRRAVRARIGGTAARLGQRSRGSASPGALGGR